jgi:hypothetical protein
MDLVERAKGILVSPKTEWAKIEGEPGGVAYLFTNYVAILAAIPPVCTFIGHLIFGVSAPGVATVRVGLAAGLIGAIVQYALAFVMVYLIALAADALAPTFGGRKDQPSALKLAVYSMTPVWLVGVFSLIPALRILGVLALYSVYLLWVGAPTLMKTPNDRSVPYVAAVVLCGLVLGFVIAAVVGAIIGAVA